MVLLDVLARLRERLGFDLSVLHVHHGLSPNADAWASLVQREAVARGVVADTARVRIVARPRASLEALAREARYAALDAMCRTHGAAVLALAHHANDQAETVLLQLMRGAGLPGLAAMPSWAEGASAARWRPLLAIERGAIDAYAQARSIVHVDDESNAQLRFRRNAVRHRVLAPLQADLPQAVSAIGRSARHIQSALELLREIGQADLARVRAGEGLSIAGLRALSDAHRVNALRTWVETLRIPAPSDARLAELWRQMSAADEAARPEVAHAGGRFMRHRDRLVFVAPAAGLHAPSVCLGWPASGAWALPDWGGAFHVQPAPHGFTAAQLAQGRWRAAPRAGGERMRIAANRPSRDLKHWYQSLGVPVWQRDAAPLLWLDEALCFVPCVGLAADLTSPGEGRFTIEWRPAA